MSLGLLLLAADATFGLAGSELDALSYAALALAMLWLTADLYRSATLVDRTKRPHRSVAGVVCLSVALAIVKADGALGLWNQVPSLAIGGATLTSALMVFASADRAAPRAAAPGPRALLVVGGLLLGSAALIEVSISSGNRAELLYPSGLGLVGVAALLLALSEARLLARMVSYSIR